MAPFIAQYPEYTQPLVDHLLNTKLRHWERSLRELASKALAALLPSQPEFFSTTAVDMLLPLCLDTVLEVQALAALLPSQTPVLLHLCRHAAAFVPWQFL